MIVTILIAHNKKALIFSMLGLPEIGILSSNSFLLIQIDLLTWIFIKVT